MEAQNTKKQNSFHALNYFEVQILADYISAELRGATLQEVWNLEHGVVLRFYQKRESYLIISLVSCSPGLFLFESSSLDLPKSPPKPVTHFLKAHMRGLRLSSAQVIESLGRVVDLKFDSHSSAPCQIQIVLIPRQPNLLARSGDKSISWFKPRSIASPISSHADLGSLPNARSIAQIHQEWMACLKNSQDAASPFIKGPATKSSIQKALEKKEAAIEKINFQIRELENSCWSELGELLKYTPIHELEAKWKPLVDPKLNQSENIQRAFLKAKQAKSKTEGARMRIQELQLEVQKLKANLVSPHASMSKGESPAPPHLHTQPLRLRAGKLRFRKLEVNSEIYACMGKSAQDNLGLLRIAKPWHLWLHLKDLPSAHVIVFFNRNRGPSESQLRQIGAWLLRESQKSGHANDANKIQGELLIAECRFVRPIKGDKLGRVTLQNSRTLRLSLSLI